MNEPASSEPSGSKRKRRWDAKPEDSAAGGKPRSEWESDEQRRFYQDLLPIKESIPAVLLVEKPALENETDAEKKRREDQESKEHSRQHSFSLGRRDSQEQGRDTEMREEVVFSLGESQESSL